MGYKEDPQQIWVEKAYGDKGIRTGTGHPENLRALQSYEQNQRTERLNREFAGAITSSSSNRSSYTWSPGSSSSSSGDGLLLIIVLAMLIGFFAAVDRIQPYTGSYESALLAVMALYAIGLLFLRLLWFLFLRFLGGIIGLLATIWDSRLGKICIYATTIVAGFYGANELDGKNGVELFGQLLLAGVVIWGAYIGLKWFCQTLVGKILLRTTVMGALIMIAWYLYAGRTP